MTSQTLTCHPKSARDPPCFRPLQVASGRHLRRSPTVRKPQSACKTLYHLRADQPADRKRKEHSHKRSSFQSVSAVTTGSSCSPPQRKEIFLNSEFSAFSISPGAAVDTGTLADTTIGTVATCSGSGGDAARIGVCGAGAGAGEAARTGIGDAARNGVVTTGGALPPGTARSRVTTSGSPDLPPRCRIIVTGELGCPLSSPCASWTCQCEFHRNPLATAS